MFKQKKKRQIRFTRPKKSSLFSTISLKDKPKRKKKALIKKIFFRFFFCFVLFLVSLGSLFIFFRTHNIVVSPLAQTSSYVLGNSTQRNPEVITNEVEAVLQKKNVLFSSVVVQGSDIDISLSDGSHAILSTDKDISNQIDSLQFTINNLTIDGKHISRVDVRFARPVVTFQ